MNYIGMILMKSKRQVLFDAKSSRRSKLLCTP
jgi:hypothetical protein